MSGAAVQRRSWRFFAPDRLAEYPGIWAASLCCTLVLPVEDLAGGCVHCGWRSYAVDLSNSTMARMPGRLARRASVYRNLLAASKTLATSKLQASLEPRATGAAASRGNSHNSKL